MKILYYASVMNGIERKLKSELRSLVPDESLEIHRNVRDMSSRLRQRKNDLFLGIILVAGKEDLDELLAVRELLYDLKIILILHKNDHESIRKGHGLRPRFLAYADNDFSEVRAVVEKLLSKSLKNRN